MPGALLGVVNCALKPGVTSSDVDAAQPKPLGVPRLSDSVGSAAAPTFAAVVLASVIDTAPALVTVKEENAEPAGDSPPVKNSVDVVAVVDGDVGDDELPQPAAAAAHAASSSPGDQTD